MSQTTAENKDLVFPGREFSVKVTGTEDNPEYSGSFVEVAENALKFVRNYNEAHDSLWQKAIRLVDRGYSLTLEERDPQTQTKIDKPLVATADDIIGGTMMLGKDDPSVLWAMLEFELIPLHTARTVSYLLDAYLRQE